MEERRDLLTDREGENFELLKLLVTHTREAIADHIKYFGHWYIPEAYPQAVCATLMKESGFSVMVEVRQADLTFIFGELAENPLYSERFRLDMMLFDSTIRQPSAAVRAIVEFKRDAKPILLAADMRRMSQLLNALAVGNDRPIGIQVLFTIHDTEGKAARDRNSFVQAITMLPDVRCTEPWPESHLPIAAKTHQGENLYYTTFASQIFVEGNKRRDGL
jgi:hypothetical protein